MPSIEVSPEAFAKLEELAGPLFSASEVIDRLLRNDGGSAPVVTGSAKKPPRSPRERGAVARIGTRQINAVSVRDLYAQVLQWLVDEKATKIEPLLPHRTSRQRYLISKKPIHPNGNPFVVPVGYKGYFMEAHKNYENAMAGLQQLGKLAGFDAEYTA